MNFLVDAQLPPAPCGWLEARGHRAVHVTQRDGALTDAAIAEWGETEGLALISKDEDFLTVRLPDHFPFPWLRCGNATNRALTEWLEAQWDRVENLLESGEKLIELV